ncbi:MAG: hypothetical protein WD598_08785 [Acidimicrobiia bacterium]
MSNVGVSRAITRDDLEAKFREVQGEGRAGADTARGIGRGVGVAAAVAAVGIAYLMGRRRGRRRRTIVEVRRV